MKHPTLLFNACNVLSVSLKRTNEHHHTRRWLVVFLSSLILKWLIYSREKKTSTHSLLRSSVFDFIWKETHLHPPGSPCLPFLALQSSVYTVPQHTISSFHSSQMDEFVLFLPPVIKSQLTPLPGLGVRQTLTLLLISSFATRQIHTRPDFGKPRFLHL